MDISGSFVDESAIEEILRLLIGALRLDTERDQFRAMLASEYWRAKRFSDAQREFRAILQRGVSHQHVAQQMIADIESRLETTR